MNTPRWETRDDGTLWCTAHLCVVVMPHGCAGCVADPGPPPDEQVLAPITFPTGCDSDDITWLRLSRDIENLDEDLAFYRKLRRRVYAKARPAPVDADEGDDAPRAKSVVVITPELIAQLALVANTIVKLQDAKTKAQRAVTELAGAHRRDQRTAQMLEAKLRAQRTARGAAS